MKCVYYYVYYLLATHFQCGVNKHSRNKPPRIRYTAAVTLNCHCYLYQSAHKRLHCVQTDIVHFCLDFWLHPPTGLSAQLAVQLQWRSLVLPPVLVMTAKHLFFKLLRGWNTDNAEAGREEVLERPKRQFWQEGRGDTMQSFTHHSGIHPRPLTLDHPVKPDWPQRERERAQLGVRRWSRKRHPHHPRLPGAYHSHLLSGHTMGTLTQPHANNGNTKVAWQPPFRLLQDKS